MGSLFLVCDASKVLQSGLVSLFTIEGIWVSFVTTKVSFLAWKAAWGKNLTLDKFQRRGWHLPNRCFLCGYDEETIHHLLLHCSIVSPLWEIVLSLVGISLGSSLKQLRL